MNKENWNICIIFLLVIIISLFIGIKYKRQEGLEMDISTTPPEDLSDELETSEKTLFKSEEDLETAKDNYNNTLDNIEVTEQQIAILSKRMVQMQKDYNDNRKEMIQNMTLLPIVSLKLYGGLSGFKNSAPPTKPIEIYGQDAMNVDIRGRPTNMDRGSIDGRGCAKFNGDGRNYISFPILPLPNFSFCFWVYFDNRTSFFMESKKRVVSLMNTSNPNRQDAVSIDIDVRRLTVEAVSALPGGPNANVRNAIRLRRPGWHHITYTYDSNATNPSNPSMKYLAKLYVDGVDTMNMNSGSSYGSGDLMGDKFENKPNVLVIGKDFNGYVSGFNYYGITLQSGDNNGENYVKHVYNTK